MPGKRRRVGRWVREVGAPDTRHRDGGPWDIASVPSRWHACRPQTVELHCDRGVLTGTYTAPAARSQTTPSRGATATPDDTPTRPGRAAPERRSPSVRGWWRASPLTPGACHHLRSHPAAPA